MRRSLAALALAVVLPMPALLGHDAHANVVVKAGETLSEIAERHGVSITRLMQANGITNPDLVIEGTPLVIPGSGSRGGSSGGGGGGGGSTVTVQPGDTLSAIADRHGLSLSRLMQLNGIADPDRVMAGQRLVVSGSSRRSPAAPAPLPTAPYTVRSGETLSEIADRFGTTTERLMAVNGIGDPNLVMAGTRLAIPGRPSAARRQAGSAPGPGGGKPGQHVVQPGESLSAIADRYGTSMDRLMAINNISDPDMLWTGARLKLQAPPAPRPAPRASTKAAAKSPAKTAAKVAAKPAAKPAAMTAAKPAAKPGNQPTESQPPAPQGQVAASPAAQGPSPAPAAVASKPEPTASKPAAAQPSALQPSGSQPQTVAGAEAKPMVRPQPVLNPQTQAAPVPAALTPAGQAPSSTSANSSPARTSSPAGPAAAAPIRPARTAGLSASTAAAGSAAIPGPGPSLAAATVAQPAARFAPRATTSAATTASAAAATATTATKATATATTTATTAAPAAATLGAAPVPARRLLARADSRPLGSPAPAAVAAATPTSSREPVPSREPIPSGSLAVRATTSSSTSTAPQAATAPARATGLATRAGRFGKADWRSYGPLQIDWSNWRPMGGSYVAPTLNGNGQALYLAVNCGARKINATSQSGQWKSWDSPQTDFEQRLISDLCRAKGT